MQTSRDQSRSGVREYPVVSLQVKLLAGEEGYVHSGVVSDFVNPQHPSGVADMPDPRPIARWHGFWLWLMAVSAGLSLLIVNAAQWGVLAGFAAISLPALIGLRAPGSGLVLSTGWAVAATAAVAATGGLFGPFAPWALAPLAATRLLRRSWRRALALVAGVLGVSAAAQALGFTPPRPEGPTALVLLGLSATTLGLASVAVWRTLADGKAEAIPLRASSTSLRGPIGTEAVDGSAEPKPADAPGPPGLMAAQLAATTPYEQGDDAQAAAAGEALTAARAQRAEAVALRREAEAALEAARASQAEIAAEWAKVRWALAAAEAAQTATEAALVQAGIELAEAEAARAKTKAALAQAQQELEAGQEAWADAEAAQARAEEAEAEVEALRARVEEELARAADKRLECEALWSQAQDELAASSLKHAEAQAALEEAQQSPSDGRTKDAEP
jgi:hypothetical protein